jgi:hypothetical protein
MAMGGSGKSRVLQGKNTGFVVAATEDIYRNVESGDGLVPLPCTTFRQIHRLQKEKGYTLLCFICLIDRSAERASNRSKSFHHIHSMCMAYGFLDLHESCLSGKFHGGDITYAYGQVGRTFVTRKCTFIHIGHSFDQPTTRSFDLHHRISVGFDKFHTNKLLSLAPYTHA